MTSATYEPIDPRVRQRTEELPAWQREIVTAQTAKVASMIQGSKRDREFLQRAWARVDRRKRRRH